jgi:AcrR family transcriptional regulator
MTGASSGPSSSLRARKKTLTRDTIEDTALRHFLDRGYDRARIEDICADSMVSQRTFFRYFTSKEDLVLGRLRAHLAQASQLFETRPAHEPFGETLRVVIAQVVQDYLTEPERVVTRLRLVTTTPALETGLLQVFAGFERLVRDFAAVRMEIAPDSRQARLLAASVVAAFRVGLEMWIDNSGGPELAGLIAGNVEAVSRGLYGNHEGGL